MVSIVGLVLVKYTWKKKNQMKLYLEILRLNYSAEYVLELSVIVIARWQVVNKQTARVQVVKGQDCGVQEVTVEHTGAHLAPIQAHPGLVGLLLVVLELHKPIALAHF